MDELVKWSTREQSQSLKIVEQHLLQECITPLRGYHLVLLGNNKKLSWIPEHHLHGFSVAPEKQTHPASVQAHYDELPLRNGSVDAVIIPYLLEYCDDPQQVINELFRVLIGEGKLFLFGFHRWHPWCWWNTPKPINPLPYWRIKQLLKNAGFHLSDAKWFHYGALYFMEVLKQVPVVTPLRPQWSKPIIEEHWQPTARKAG